MAKKCRLCGGLAKSCGKNIYGEEVYECTICLEPGHHSRFDDVTLFTEITKSPEALAEKVVYFDGLGFTSPFIDISYFVNRVHEAIDEEKYFKARDKAIAATVAKLNEVIEYE